MNTQWKLTETEHYIFHYKIGSLAESELEQITTLQESCFKEITHTLKFIPCNKIHYWLCDTRKEVMELSNIGYEANGVTHCNPSSPSIYAMYSADLKCIDFHEDTHAIACQYACPTLSLS